MFQIVYLDNNLSENDVQICVFTSEYDFHSNCRYFMYDLRVYMRSTL